MTSLDNTILQFETTLCREAQRRIRQLGGADLLIGIPSHRNGRTIGEVADAVVAAVRTYYPDQRIVLMNADGGSSDSTVRHLRDLEVPDNVHKLLTMYEGVTGKGTAIRCILEAAGRLHVRACLVLEARAIGIQPEWLPALVSPVLHGDDIVMACYQRAAVDSALTDNLVYPFLHSFWGSDLREPLAGEFCVSGEMAVHLAACDVWETNVARFGVNAWLALHALTEPLRVAQVDLGYRGPNGGELAALGDQRFAHVVDTLFRALTVNRRSWTQGAVSASVPFRGLRAADRIVECEDCVAPLAEAFRAGACEYAAEWQGIISADTLASLRQVVSMPDDEMNLSVALWVRLVYEFATVFNKGEGDPDKVVEALLPIFYGRAATYVKEVSSLSVYEREAIVQGLCLAFDEQRGYFQHLWDTYQEWEDDVTRFWTS
jgi:hypothetical protein